MFCRIITLQQLTATPQNVIFPLYNATKSAIRCVLPPMAKTELTQPAAAEQEKTQFSMASTTTHTLKTHSTGMKVMVVVW